jgi:hypothetical protein
MTVLVQDGGMAGPSVILDMGSGKEMKPFDSFKALATVGSLLSAPAVCTRRRVNHRQERCSVLPAHVAVTQVLVQGGTSAVLGDTLNPSGPGARLFEQQLGRFSSAVVEEDELLQSFIRLALLEGRE